MADTWTTPLPGPASAGVGTHLQDHDALTAALVELRTAVEALTALACGLEQRINQLERPEYWD